MELYRLYPYKYDPGCAWSIILLRNWSIALVFKSATLQIPVTWPACAVWHGHLRLRNECTGESRPIWRTSWTKQNTFDWIFENAHHLHVMVFSIICSTHTQSMEEVTRPDHMKLHHLTRPPEVNNVFGFWQWSRVIFPANWTSIFFVPMRWYVARLGRFC